VEAVGIEVPPEAPALGACWIIGGAPSGAWAGHAGAVAGWTASGWRFVAPRDGFAVWDQAGRRWAVRVDGTWETGALRGDRVLVGGQQVVGARVAAIPSPSGGATIDAEARASLAAVLAALRTHGLIAS
jgi:hypothetical protein